MKEFFRVTAALTALYSGGLAAHEIGWFSTDIDKRVILRERKLVCNREPTHPVCARGQYVGMMFGEQKEM